MQFFDRFAAFAGDDAGGVGGFDAPEEGLKEGKGSGAGMVEACTAIPFAYAVFYADALGGDDRVGVECLEASGSKEID